MKYLIIFLFLLGFSAPLMAVTYYVALEGNDQANGTSPQTAWKSVNKVNSVQLMPGDVVLFKAGQSFNGNLYLDGEDAKQANNPVRIGSFDEGRATIIAGNGSGLFAYNTAGLTIENLVFVGSGIGQNNSDGVIFYNTLAQSTKLEGVILRNLKVSGFGKGGIVLYGEGVDGTKSGFRNVLIEYAEVFDNADVGVMVGGLYAPQVAGFPNEQVIIRHVQAYRNPGVANKGNHSGSGILLGNSKNGLIEYCRAWENGANNNYSGGGPVGIWTWDADQIVMQFNESHHNRTTTLDGGGFDIDGGVTNSIMQYNYSHDNMGSGFLIAQFSGAPISDNNIIRYNISENDGRKNSIGGILFWKSSTGAEVRNTKVYGNTVYVDRSYNADVSAVRVSSSGFKGIDFINNIFVTKNKARIVHVAGGSDVRFLANAYWETQGNENYFFRGSTYSSLNAWRTARGVERWNGSSVGYEGDPQVNQLGGGGLIADPVNMHQKLPAYQLKSTSPVLTRGLAVETVTGQSGGSMDFYRQPLPASLSRSIGAHQHQAGSVTPPATTYTLTTTVSGQGTVARSPNLSSYSAGQIVALTATPASGWQFSGWSGGASGTANPLNLTINANTSVTANFVATTTSAQSVTALVLINPATEQAAGALANGQQINIDAFPNQQINVQALTNPSVVGSVIFRLIGPTAVNRTESTAPYALFGDLNGIDFNGGKLLPGNYTLTATPYTLSGGTGTAGQALSINFSVVQGGAARFAQGGLAEAAAPVAHPLVYPNPASQEVWIQGRGKGEMAGVLYNAAGQLEPIALTRREAGLWHIDLSKLPKGMYILRLMQQGQTTQSVKIVKE